MKNNLKYIVITTLITASLIELVTEGSAAVNSVQVSINGVKENYAQPAFQQNGHTLVPLRGIFESLGVEVAWDGATLTVTATKGSTTIILTLDKDLASVNGKSIKLSAKAQSINGSTMVPLRFVSEALGAKVEWDGPTKTAIITSKVDQVKETPTQETKQGQKIGSIQVKYGQHTYASKNQAEYDEVMQIVEKAVANYDNVEFDNGGMFKDYFKQYIESGVPSGMQKGSMEYRGMVEAHGSLNVLVKAFVSKAEIAKVYKTSLIAANLLKGVKAESGPPQSAYDALIRKVTDCDSDAQVYSAVFDAMGYNTLIIGGPGHADMLVQIEGKWYNPQGASFKNDGYYGNPRGATTDGGLHLVSSPTNGSF